MLALTAPQVEVDGPLAAMILEMSSKWLKRILGMLIGFPSPIYSDSESYFAQSGKITSQYLYMHIPHTYTNYSSK